MGVRQTHLAVENFQNPALAICKGVCYNLGVRLRGGRNRRDTGHDLYHTPGRMTARDRRHAKRGVRQGRVATSADVRNLAYLALCENRHFSCVKSNM